MFDITKDERYIFIRPEIAESLIAYGRDHVRTGGFLEACLSNDLKEAMGRADFYNAHHIYEIMLFIVNEMPAACHGSREHVKRWLEMAPSRATGVSSDADWQG